MEAIINIGLSGSGKSFNNSKYPDYKVISKDIYRKRFVRHDPSRNFWLSYKYSDPNVENNVISTMSNEIITSSKKGENIIIDNTNLSPYRTFELKEFLSKLGYTIRVINYNTTDDINYYLSNNKKRLDSVESTVINDQFINACINELIPLESKDILLVDVEGTLLQTNQNSYHTNEYITDLLKHLDDTNYCDYIQFVSNQTSDRYSLILDWLSSHGFDMSKHRLLCRKSIDKRPEIAVKSELFNNCFKHNNLLAVMEDNIDIFFMYQDIGLPVLKVSR